MLEHAGKPPPGPVQREACGSEPGGKLGARQSGVHPAERAFHEHARSAGCSYGCQAAGVVRALYTSWAWCTLHRMPREGATSGSMIEQTQPETVVGSEMAARVAPHAIRTGPVQSPHSEVEFLRGGVPEWCCRKC